MSGMGPGLALFHSFTVSPEQALECTQSATSRLLPPSCAVWWKGQHVTTVGSGCSCPQQLGGL